MRSQSFLLGSREELHLKAGSLGEIDQKICNCYLISSRKDKFYEVPQFSMKLPLKAEIKVVSSCRLKNVVVIVCMTVGHRSQEKMSRQ